MQDRKNFLFVLLSIGVCIVLIFLVSCHKNVHDKKNLQTAESMEKDYPPMVMVDGRLYQDTGYVHSALKCGTPDGEILHSVPPNKKPERDDESNFGTGYEYQKGWKDYIVVKRNKDSNIFQDISIDRKEIPEGVAYFKGRVIEVLEDTFLVTITEIPEEFRWVFQYKESKEIKPISLHTENVFIPENEKTLDITDLKGKMVQVWFDGSLKNSEDHMSYPTELGEVYKISILK